MYLLVGILFIVSFVLWTLAVSFVDVQPIGPQESSVGFAKINTYIHNLFGVHMSLYIVTDWLSLVPLAFAFAFAALGLAQWIKRKHIANVDVTILVLGAFYLIVMSIYLLFESVVINYRPVLINGYLEASYPSSTTMLCLCLLPSAAIQLKERIKHIFFRRAITTGIHLFSLFMIIARLLSGVHWITDIIAGVLISTGLLFLYKACCIVARRKAPIDYKK